MDDGEDSDGRADLISRLFALLTARLEDAATIAAECQGRGYGEDHPQRAQQLASLIDEAATVNQAILALHLAI